MKPTVIRHINDFPKLNYAIVALGNFDGIHLGHQALIHKIAQIKQQTNGKTIIFTFYPHPLKIIKQTEETFLMQSFREKYNTLCKFDTDIIFCARFTKEFAMTNPEVFVKKYLIDGINTKELCVGYNYTFGKLGKGTVETLRGFSKMFGFKLHVIPAFKINGITVSSSKIRKFLQVGDIKNANLFLGRYYSIQGVVQKGKQRGKLLGFPTANIYLNRSILLKEGVYAGFATIDGKNLKAAINIGSNPTFNDNISHIEAFLLDFSVDIYNKRITLSFVDYIRREIKFESVEKLQHQVNSDIIAIKNILEKVENL